MWLRLGDSVGRYKIQRPIGRGGFSEVYLAEDSQLHRHVALKIGYRNLPNDSFCPLLNEGRILAELQHPSILNIFDVGDYPEDLIYLVLEYVDGGTLQDTLQENGVQPPYQRIVSIVANVADALDYVHRRGYLHRNLKPQVILQDSGGQPRLTGFEVAVQKAELASAERWGTLSYMAPEQVLDIPEQLGPHTDVWGLGVTLYEALTGHLPFNLSYESDLERVVNTTEPALPSSKNRSIPAELDRICLKCLAKTPEERYSNAALLATDLRVCQQAMQPTPQRRVFVSHSSQDRDFVEREIISQLESHGFNTWYSKVNIQTASEWERSILRGLESCEWFLVVLSQRSLSSEWVKDELHWAIDKRPNRIIPVLMEDCSLRDFHIRLARIQCVDFRSPSREERGKLMELLSADALYS
jgi:serine/threonine protein kinase